MLKYDQLSISSFSGVGDSEGIHLDNSRTSLTLVVETEVYVEDLVGDS